MPSLTLGSAQYNQMAIYLTVSYERYSQPLSTAYCVSCEEQIRFFSENHHLEHQLGLNLQKL